MASSSIVTRSLSPFTNAEFCITTREPQHWLGAFVNTEHWMGDRTESMLRLCSLAPRDPKSAIRFQDIAFNALAASATRSGFEESEAAKHAASELLSLLKPIAFHRNKATAQAHGRPKPTHDEIIRRSCAILEENWYESPSVAELASTCDVPKRTLRTDLALVRFPVTTSGLRGHQMRVTTVGIAYVPVGVTVVTRATLATLAVTVCRDNMRAQEPQAYQHTIVVKKIRSPRGFHSLT